MFWQCAGLCMRFRATSNTQMRPFLKIQMLEPNRYYKSIIRIRRMVLSSGNSGGTNRSPGYGQAFCQKKRKSWQKPPELAPSWGAEPDSIKLAWGGLARATNTDTYCYWPVEGTQPQTATYCHNSLAFCCKVVFYNPSIFEAYSKKA